ncbi:MAG: hypothetical protein LBC61_00090 [Candidatus Peribacteria bacterium]|jgi:hypothetical protein|nr:hypothetical protein [Candidatus Peribacteria bacterium]
MQGYSDDEIKMLYQMFVKADKLKMTRRKICETIGMSSSKFYHLKGHFIRGHDNFDKRWVDVAGGELSNKKFFMDFSKINAFLEIVVHQND